MPLVKEDREGSFRRGDGKSAPVSSPDKPGIARQCGATADEPRPRETGDSELDRGQKRAIGSRVTRAATVKAITGPARRGTSVKDQTIS